MDFEKKKVLFLGSLPPPFIGPSLACRTILNSELKNRFELIHLDKSDHRDIRTLGEFDFMNIFLAFKHIFMVKWLIIRHRPDLVYIPNGQNSVIYIRDSIFILISKIFGRRVICHLRGGNFLNWYNSCGKIMQWWVRFVHRKVDGQIVLGENLRYLFNWVLPENKIFVVPNGADYTFPPKNVTDNKVRVLFLGNFIGTKGVVEALKAGILLKKNKSLLFQFAGSWNEKETEILIKKTVKDNSDTQIEVLGQVIGEKKDQLLANADILVFPTYYPSEGHPWVIVEAMAAGLPVISTDHAAIPESVIDGYNGFLVEKRNSRQIAEKIAYLFENETERIRMGKNSRKHYLEGFTEKRMVDLMTESFKKTLGE